jgi:hypothetical protein
MMFMVVINIGSWDDMITSLLYLTLLSYNLYCTLSPKQGFSKGHVEVYRASVDELLQFHQLKWNSNHFDMFYLNAQKLPGFFYAWNAMHTSVASIL